MDCPLCKSKNIKVLHKIESKDLVFLYKKMTGEDFSDLLNTNINYCTCNDCKLGFYAPLIVGDERFYNSLQKFKWYYTDDKYEFSIAKDYIKNSDLILEVGSGRGNFCKFLKTQNYVGLDFSVEAKKMAEKDGITIENVTIENYSTENIEKFDIVCSFQVLEHVNNPFEFLQSKINALKKHGKLIIAVPNEDSFIGTTTNSTLNMPPHHVTRWGQNTLQYVAKLYNLKLIDIKTETLQKIHYSWYLANKFQNRLLENKIIDLSAKRKFISKLSGIYAIITKGFINKNKLPVGHTIVAVYEKI